VPAPLRIFLSYRREDASGHAGRLYDVLAKRYGSENVFMDIDTIDVGRDFAEVISNAVASCDALIALVGRQWLTATDASGKRRLDDPNDFVRLELEAALQRDVAVVPACVQGAAHPSAEQLPDSLAPLARRQGVELHDIGWHDDVNRLIERLERLVEGPPKPRRSRRLLFAAVAVGVVLVLAAVAAVLIATRSSDGNGGNGPASGGSFPNATEEKLLAEVPLITRTNCARIDWGDKAALASVECSGARLAVRYQLFPSASVRDAWYTQKREDVGIEPGAGECTADKFYGEIDYGGGTAICYFNDKQEPQMAWADEGSKVGVESNVWKGTGKPAVESMLRQWQCCLLNRSE
jgi:hypothetical protein